MAITKRILHVLRRLVLSATQRRPVVTDDPGLRLPTESDSYDRSYDLVALNEDGSFFGSAAFDARSHDAAKARAAIYAGTWHKSVQLYWTPPASPSSEGVEPKKAELIWEVPMPIRIPIAS